MPCCLSEASCKRHHIPTHLSSVISIQMLKEGIIVGGFTLELDFVLDNKSLALIVYGLIELCGNGMMSCWVFDHKTFVSLNAL